MNTTSDYDFKRGFFFIIYLESLCEYQKNLFSALVPSRFNVQRYLVYVRCGKIGCKQKKKMILRIGKEMKAAAIALDL